jgi:hypothetical protein
MQQLEMGRLISAIQSKDGKLRKAAVERLKGENYQTASETNHALT